MSFPPAISSRIRRVEGFGQVAAADGYLFRPLNDEQVAEVFQIARSTGRKVVLRGAGRSYGDASIASEALILDITRMSRILKWSPDTGVIEVEGGATIEDLWRYVIEDGFWPPVVSGTMFPTIAGALAMNIHGKNNFCKGTFGEQVVSIDVVFPNGETKTLSRNDDLFWAVISGTGLLGVIVRAKIQMQRVPSGNLRVLPISCENWDSQFEAFQTLESEADYMVSWIDAFASGGQAGRGLFHAAWYQEETGQAVPSLSPDAQDLPDTILGFIPKSVTWRLLRPFNNRMGMRMINAAKHQASKRLGDGKPYAESLVAFSFLLDYVPNWRRAYKRGFLQYQSFLPKETAKQVFGKQLEWAREAGQVPFLAVMKRHRPDNFLLSHGVDGYSLALDFKVTSMTDLRTLAHRFNELVVSSGGRFYLAKDSTLRPSDYRESLPPGTIERFLAIKRELDPEGLLTSELAKRLELVNS